MNDDTIFHTFFDTSSEKFQNYYKDVSMRMKNKELDLLIVNKYMFCNIKIACKILNKRGINHV